MTAIPYSGVTRRRLLLGSASVLLAGCDSTPSLSLVKDSFSVAFPDSSAYPRSREQVDAQPYAQLGVRIGGGARGIMVLSEKRADELYWISANRVLLVTRKGRIVRTVGLPTDVLGTRIETRDLLDYYDPEHPQIDGLETALSIDVGNAYGAKILSRYHVEGSETITVLGESYDTLRVREQLSCDSWSWRATSMHWLSKRSAMMWRSRQSLAKGLPPIEFETLKRPG